MNGKWTGGILAIYCSARKPSNSGNLLDAALEPIIENGIGIERVFIRELYIKPCAACEICFDGGPCPIEDDMTGLYPKLENARGIIIASPIYFYGLPSQAKAFIDRCQPFWARKYLLANPLPTGRLGGVIAVAGSGGEKVFDGFRLTVKYFLDALSIEMPEMLTIRDCERDPFYTPESELRRAREYGKEYVETITGRI